MHLIFSVGKKIKAADIEPLQALRIIEYVPSNSIDNPYDFALKFQFAPNDYFENIEIVKRFYMIDEHEALKTDCTKVNWKPGKDITRMEIKKTQKNKKTGATRTIDRIVDKDSFFTFFRSMESKEWVEDEDEEENVEVMNSVLEGFVI